MKEKIPKKKRFLNVLLKKLAKRRKEIEESKKRKK